MVETENDGRGGVLCFDLARMFAYLRNTPKKPPATQARGEREPRKWDAGGLTGQKGTGSGREMQNAKLLSPFIYFVKTVRMLSQNQEPSDINEVRFCALITQNFTS